VSGWGGKHEPGRQLCYSNDGFMVWSPAGWHPNTRITYGTLCSYEYETNYLCLHVMYQSYLVKLLCTVFYCPGLQSTVWRPGFEPATCWSQVQHPNHSATKPYIDKMKILVVINLKNVYLLNINAVDWLCTNLSGLTGCIAAITIAEKTQYK